VTNHSGRIEYSTSQSANSIRLSIPLFNNIATSNHIMASAKPLTMLVVRSRPTARLSNSVRTFAPSTSPLTAFSTSPSRTYATPSGPPPPGFRLPKPERWDQSKESSLDKAGKYFLLTEMARGMYVVLEQFFRPPWVQPLSFRMCLGIAKIV
jgi:hypothetical protein